MNIIKDNKRYSNRGQGLVEVLVALGIATIVLSAIAVVVISSLRNTQYSQNQNLATQFASQGMEVVRKIRDSTSSLQTVLDGSGSAINYCLPQNANSLSVRTGATCPQNIDPRNIQPSLGNIYSFIREVAIYHPTDTVNNKCAESTTYKTYYVVVSVAWWDNACVNTSIFCHKLDLSSCFADRKNIIPVP